MENTGDYLHIKHLLLPQNRQNKVKKVIFHNNFILFILVLRNLDFQDK